MASISQFKSQMVNGGFRPNQFQVNMVFPQNIGGNAAAQAVRFLAKSATLPAFNLETVTTSYRGRQVKFAGERTFQPWTIEVYLDTEFGVRDAFESWVNSIQFPNTTGGAIRPNTYQTDISVVALDRNDVSKKSYVLRDAFPTEIGAVQLDWEQNNQIGTFQVTFEYNYFESTTGNGVVIASS